MNFHDKRQAAHIHSTALHNDEKRSGKSEKWKIHQNTIDRIGPLQKGCACFQASKIRRKTILHQTAPKLNYTLSTGDSRYDN